MENNSKLKECEIYFNPGFGDLWIKDGDTFVKINNGYTIGVDEPEGFVKVGQIYGDEELRVVHLMDV